MDMFGSRNGSDQGVVVAKMSLRKPASRVLQSQSDLRQSVHASMASPVWHNAHYRAATCHWSKAEDTGHHFDDCRNLVGQYLLCLNSHWIENFALTALLTGQQSDDWQIEEIGRQNDALWRATVSLAWTYGYQ